MLLHVFDVTRVHDNSDALRIDKLKRRARAGAVVWRARRESHAEFAMNGFDWRGAKHCGKTQMKRFGYLATLQFFRQFDNILRVRLARPSILPARCNHRDAQRRTIDFIEDFVLLRFRKELE